MTTASGAWSGIPGRHFTPVVILESGGGQGGYGWRKVQSGVAQFTTVCWYDRAGEGWSDPVSFARSSASIVSDLHELLQHAAIPGPYVLVGHSVGGEYVRIYANRFPSEVAGVVLVDSSHPDQREPPAMLSPINRNHSLSFEVILVRRLLIALLLIVSCVALSMAQACLFRTSRGGNRFG